MGKGPQRYYGQRICRLPRKRRRAIRWPSGCAYIRQPDKNSLKNTSLSMWKAQWLVMDSCRQSKHFVPEPYIGRKIFILRGKMSRGPLLWLPDILV
ncbi:Hypothetical protein FKW44_012910 [Caligus rogercresseyi]|uniref:Uncharacterized protein n=1 Tax=Caligus rogercresseyi TaxID=217165 RepID=A0A7T8K9W0_CALRO|nr:Hypothetical protein FKW44_012910 [Caligus rogercresseyi]